MQATQQLKDEHEGIRVALAVLEKMSGALEAGKDADMEDLKGILEFLRVFADKCHHGKEEDMLFPALEKAGVPKEGGPIGMMLTEHDEGRAFIRGMREGIQRYAQGDIAAAAEIARNARGYVAVLSQHINKENNVLFPLADRVLPSDEQKALVREFDTLETEKIGPGKHEEFHRFLERLEKEYLK